MTTRNIYLTLLVTTLGLSACSGGGGGGGNPLINDPALIDDPNSVPGEGATPGGNSLTEPATSGESSEGSASAEQARFMVTLENLWAVEEFPQGFPDDAHLSLIGGATHNEAVSFWDVGDVASRGIEDMAEAGLIDRLLFDEVAPAITSGTADSMIEIREYTDAFIDGVPGITTFEIQMDANWPLVSMVTMLGPSPDWFVGVSGLSLRNDGEWVTQLSVDLPLYDGGSKSDITPIMGGPDIIPPNPVSLVAYDATTGVYLPSSEAQIVARLTFERVTLN